MRFKLVEQKYTNTKRILYRSTNDPDLEKDLNQTRSYLTTPVIFFTNSIDYAAWFADMRKFKYIESIKFNKDLNIFNANSREDLVRLMTLLKECGVGLSLKELDILKEKDWMELEDRNFFIDAVAQIKGRNDKYLYDGFFNYEGYEALKNFHKIDLRKNPSIGLFDVNHIEIIQQMEMKKFWKTKVGIEILDSKKMNRIGNRVSMLLEQSNPDFSKEDQETLDCYDLICNRYFLANKKRIKENNNETNV